MPKSGDMLGTVPQNKFNIAIFGAGPAGLSLAYFLAQKGYQKIAVFETGNESFKAADSAEFLENKSMSEKTFNQLKNYAFRSQLGGLSQLWTANLLPYYSFGGNSFLTQLWKDHQNSLTEILGFFLKDPKEILEKAIADFMELSKFSDDIFHSLCLHLKNSQLWNVNKNYFESSNKITIFRNSKLLDLQWDETKTLAQMAEVQVSGQSIKVGADHFALCCGSLENTRLLLNWSQKHWNESVRPIAFRSCWNLRTIDVLEDPNQGSMVFDTRRLDRSRQGRAFLVSKESGQPVVNISDFTQINAKWTYDTDQKFSASLHDYKKTMDGLINPQVETRRLALKFEETQDHFFCSLSANKDSSGLMKMQWEGSLSDDYLHKIRKATLSSLGFLRSELVEGVSNNFPITIENLSQKLRSVPYFFMDQMQKPANESMNLDANFKIGNTKNVFCIGNNILPSMASLNPTLTLAMCSFKLSQYLLRSA